MLSSQCSPSCGYLASVPIFERGSRTGCAEYPNGKVKAPKDTDRKPIVLARVRRYLVTGHVGQPTRIPAPIVREESPPARLGPRDRLYYRWYAKEFDGVMRLLRDLTAGGFRDGAVARVLAMEFWTRGEAPTRFQTICQWIWHAAIGRGIGEVGHLAGWQSSVRHLHRR
jgi:hypothetical protein